MWRPDEPTHAEEKTQDLPALPAKGLDGCLRTSGPNGRRLVAADSIAQIGACCGADAGRQRVARTELVA